MIYGWHVSGGLYFKIVFVSKDAVVYFCMVLPTDSTKIGQISSIIAFLDIYAYLHTALHKSSVRNLKT